MHVGVVVRCCARGVVVRCCARRGQSLCGVVHVGVVVRCCAATEIAVCTFQLVGLVLCAGGVVGSPSPLRCLLRALVWLSVLCCVIRKRQWNLAQFAVRE